MKYQLYTYDLWGNDKDGYNINDYCRQETYDIDEEMTDKEIFKLIGIESKFLAHVEIDNNICNERVIYIIRKKNHKPVCELRKLKD